MEPRRRDPCTVVKYNTHADPGGQIMVRYFYAWTPIVAVGTIVLLSLPWLGLIALMLVSLVALGTLAWATVWVPLMLSHAISRRWQARSGAMQWTAAALAPANSVVQPTRPAPTGATVLLATRPSEQDG